MILYKTNYDVNTSDVNVYLVHNKLVTTHYSENDTNY